MLMLVVFQQVHGDAEGKDGSFTETLASAAEKPSVNMRGKTADAMQTFLSV